MKVSHWNIFVRYLVAGIIFPIGLVFILLALIGQMFQIPMKLLNNFLDGLE